MASQNKRPKAKKGGTKAKFLNEFGQVIIELNDVLAGRRQAQNAYDLLDTLECITRRNEPIHTFSEIKNEIIDSRNT
jgi:hypothetical protein